jgi:hypothetical protein
MDFLFSPGKLEKKKRKVRERKDGEKGTATIVVGSEKRKRRGKQKGSGVNAIRLRRSLFQDLVLCRSWRSGGLLP